MAGDDEQAEETRAVFEALQRIEQMKDPVSRAAAISDVLKYVADHESRWRDLRRDVVLDLLKEHSYRKVGAMVHTSHSTVQSIERGHAGAWRSKPRKKTESKDGSSEPAGGSERDGDGATAG